MITIGRTDNHPEGDNVPRSSYENMFSTGTSVFRNGEPEEVPAELLALGLNANPEEIPEQRDEGHVEDSCRMLRMAWADVTTKFAASGQQDGTVGNFFQFAQGYPVPAIALSYMYCMSLSDSNKQLLEGTVGGRNIPKGDTQDDSQWTKKRKAEDKFMGHIAENNLKRAREREEDTVHRAQSESEAKEYRYVYIKYKYIYYIIYTYIYEYILGNASYMK